MAGIWRTTASAGSIVLLVDGEPFVRKPLVRGIEVQVGWDMRPDLQGNRPF